MPNPSVDFTIAQSLVFEQLNVATVTAGVFNDAANGSPRWQQANILNSIVTADFEVAKTICETAGHPRRNYYKTSAIVANQGPLPTDAIGPLDSVLITKTDTSIVTAIPAPTDWINIFNNAPNQTFGGALYSQGYYQQINGRLQFSGVTATVNYFTVAIGTAAVNGLVSPPEFINAVVRGAVVAELLKESEYVDAAQIFDRDYQRDLDSIRALGVTVAPLEAVQLSGA